MTWLVVCIKKIENWLFEFPCVAAFCVTMEMKPQFHYEDGESLMWLMW